MNKLNTLLFIFFFGTALVSNAQERELIEKAWNTISEAEYINYSSTSYWPNPVGRIDTTHRQLVFIRNNNKYFDYNFIFGSNQKDEMVYINDKLMEVNHTDKTVYHYTEKDLIKHNRIISQSYSVKLSPLTLLDPTNFKWTYQKDTLLDGEKLSYYRVTESDEYYGEDHVVAYFNIYLDQTTAFLDRVERDLYRNGESTQKIIFTFDNYVFKRKDYEPLTYLIPEGYEEKNIQERWNIKPLAEGSDAPGFLSLDMDKKPFTFNKFDGKYILLNFSQSNCGWCKKALEYVNRKEYTMSDKIEMVYINDHDSKEVIIDYMTKVNIPGLVIPNAKQISKTYGVNIYPTFFLISPDRKIEKVVIGYHEDFLDSLSNY